MTADRPVTEPRTEAERFGMWATDSPEVFALAKALDAVNGPLSDGDEEPFPSWQRDWADQVQEELRLLGFEVRAGAAPLSFDEAMVLARESASEGAAPRAEGPRCPIEGCDELPEDHYHPAPAIEDEDRLTAAIHWHYCGGTMPPPGSTTALGMCGYSDAHRALAQTLIALLPPASRPSDERVPESEER